MTLVLLSPLALAAINPDGSADWQRLADIAQTYAAASAVLALLALGGVAVSLVLQAREMKAARAQAVRQMHVDLLKMAMDDPVYMACWGPLDPEKDRDRQHTYVNLIISYWLTAYGVGEMNEALLRAAAAELFSGEPGRRFWRGAREIRISTAPDRRSRRFHEVIDAEYVRATQPPAPSGPAAQPEKSPRP